METAKKEFNVTYYVGAMLAQGGVLIIRDDSVLFAPRALERTMGAKDEIIHFDHIKMVEVTGTITENLMVRTREKAHRFVGSDLHKISELIDSCLQEHQSRRHVAATVPATVPVAVVSTLQAANESPKIQQEMPSQATLKGSHFNQCESCFKPIKSDFNFCPHCKSMIRPSCPDCHKGVDPTWKFCAFCSVTLKP